MGEQPRKTYMEYRIVTWDYTHGAMNPDVDIYPTTFFNKQSAMDLRDQLADTDKPHLVFLEERELTHWHKVDNNG